MLTAVQRPKLQHDLFYIVPSLNPKTSDSEEQAFFYQFIYTRFAGPTYAAAVI